MYVWIRINYDTLELSIINTHCILFAFDVKRSELKMNNNCV